MNVASEKQLLSTTATEQMQPCVREETRAKMLFTDWHTTLTPTSTPIPHNMGGHPFFLDESIADNASSPLDTLVAPGLRLWMLLALVFGIFLLMSTLYYLFRVRETRLLVAIIICCFMKIRIPRTKREIELHAAKRKNQRAKKRQKKDDPG